VLIIALRIFIKKAWNANNAAYDAFAGHACICRRKNRCRSATPREERYFSSRLQAWRPLYILFSCIHALDPCKLSLFRHKFNSTPVYTWWLVVHIHIHVTISQIYILIMNFTTRLSAVLARKDVVSDNLFMYSHSLIAPSRGSSQPCLYR